MRGKSPVYKPCHIVEREVGVKSVDERRRRHGHKPEGYGTALSVPAVGANTFNSVVLKAGPAD